MYIWKQLPDSYDTGPYYVDGDKIVTDSGGELLFGGFQKRVTKIRKEIKK